MKDFFCVKALDVGEMWVCIRARKASQIEERFPLMSIIEDYEVYLSSERIAKIKQIGTYSLEEIPKPIADRLT